MIKKYVKKPIEVEAVQWTGDNTDEIEKFTNIACLLRERTVATKLRIVTLEGRMDANLCDYIIKGVNDEFYPCKPDIFEKTYEEVKWRNL